MKEFQTSWRHRRLLLELKALQQDPPDGINAKPLDSSCFYWQGKTFYKIINFKINTFIFSLKLQLQDHMAVHMKAVYSIYSYKYL